MLKDLDIPSVRERDPDPDAGPRLNVLKFKLQGIVEYPELGIKKSDIEKLIEGIRYDLMQDYKVLPSGFTEEELGQVAGMLGEIEEETTDRHVTDTDLQRLVWLVREQRSKRGITLGQIETVADRITKFYRERGFILAKAYIPEQEVRDGIVTLTLLLGTLGEVKVEGNKIYNSDSIVSVFDGMLTNPVTADSVEENLYLINDYPGLSVVGYFEPGDQVGDTRLQLKVQDEKRYEGMARLDNHGSKQTGEYRLYAEGRVNNLAGLSDQLTLGALHSFYPDDTLYGQLRYSAYLFSPRFNVSAGTSTNQFVLGDSADQVLNKLQLYGKTKSTQAGMLYKISRSRISTHTVSLTYNHVTSNLESGNNDINLNGILDSEVSENSLSYHFDVLNEDKMRLHQGTISATSGKLSSELDIGKEETYNIYSGDYSFLTFWKVPFVNANTRILLRSSWQYSKESLSSIKQFSLAGPTVVRAYPVNTFAADSAIFAGIEWIFDKPTLLGFEVTDGLLLNELLQPYLFADASYGIQKSLLENVDDVQGALSDAGFGFRINYRNSITGNLQFAFPVQKRFSSPDFDESKEGMHVVFDFEYNF